jgi:hypothetical protein
VLTLGTLAQSTALRPFASPASMSSRYGSHALDDGLRLGRISLSTGPSAPCWASKRLNLSEASSCWPTLSLYLRFC